MPKRTHTSNWDKREKQIFLSILREYLPILQNKTVNAHIVKSKVKVWNDIYRKFNNLNARWRDLSQLKIQWRRMRLHAQISKAKNPNKESFDSELDADSTDGEEEEEVSVEEVCEPPRVEVQSSARNKTTSRLRELKEKEQTRRMEMVEEKHVIELNILKQKMECALLERQLLEIQVKNIHTNNNNKRF